MDAKEYLLENIGNSNLPEEMYIDEISEMMEMYGNLRYQEGLSEKSSDISPIMSAKRTYSEKDMQAAYGAGFLSCSQEIYSDAKTWLSEYAT